MVLQLVRHQFTVKQFHQMAEAGILSENERVELIRGEMIDMSPIGRRHAGCVNRLVNFLIQLLGKQIVLAPQNPVELDETSEPQPDIALLKPRPDFYRNSHPQPEDIFLLIAGLTQNISQTLFSSFASFLSLTGRSANVVHYSVTCA